MAEELFHGADGTYPITLIEGTFTLPKVFMMNGQMYTARHAGNDGCSKCVFNNIPDECSSAPKCSPHARVNTYQVRYFNGKKKPDISTLCNRGDTFFRLIYHVYKTYDHPIIETFQI